VSLVIRIADRAVHVVGLTNCPDESWMLQVDRRLPDSPDGALAGERSLIVELDTKYSRRFRDFHWARRQRVIRQASLSPNLNAFGERFLRSIEEECLTKMIFVGQVAFASCARGVNDASPRRAQ